jgi:hypothetical protein
MAEAACKKSANDKSSAGLKNVTELIPLFNFGFITPHPCAALA